MTERAAAPALQYATGQDQLSPSQLAVERSDPQHWGLLRELQLATAAVTKLRDQAEKSQWFSKA